MCYAYVKIYKEAAVVGYIYAMIEMVTAIGALFLFFLIPVLIIMMPYYIVKYIKDYKRKKKEHEGHP